MQGDGWVSLVRSGFNCRLAGLFFLISSVLIAAHANEAEITAGACHVSSSSEKRRPYMPPPTLDDGIEVADIRAAAVDISCVNALLTKLSLQPADGGFQDLHSLLVFKDGQLWLEEYFFGSDDYIDFENGIQRIKRPAIQWDRDKKHYIASVNKALTSNLTGIALNQLQMTVEQSLAPSLPAYKDYFTDPNKAAITWRDMLTMQAGFVWDEWQADDLKQLWKSEDFTRFLLEKQNMGPESQWRYNSAVPNVILRALGNLLGEPIREWADREFYQALGITDYLWGSQPGGYPEGSARMFMRPRDMLKIGITWLNNGVWQGQQVLPASWVKSISTPQVKSIAGEYSYFFWLRELGGVSYLSADGDGGQYINVFPEYNMVIIMTAGNYLQWPLYRDQADDIMVNYLFPVFGIKGK